MRSASRFRFPWPFLLLCAAAPASVLAFSLAYGPGIGFMAGFDLSAVAYVAAVGASLGGRSSNHLQRHAEQFESSRAIRMIVALAMVAAVVTAVASELTGVGGRRPLGLALATLACAWTFANVSFAIHYAHLFHRTRDGEAPSLIFPGKEPPDFWDFVYFAFVLGMTFQVSDVVIADRRIRRQALVHGLLAFVFSLGVLALSVNLLASAI